MMQGRLSLPDDRTRMPVEQAGHARTPFDFSEKTGRVNRALKEFRSSESLAHEGFDQDPVQVLVPPDRTVGALQRLGLSVSRSLRTQVGERTGQGAPSSRPHHRGSTSVEGYRHR